MTCSFTCWFHSISLQIRNCLKSNVKICSKMTRLPVRALSTLCEQQMLRSAGRTLQDPSHVLSPVFEWLPSGCQLCCPGCRTSLSLCSPCWPYYILYYDHHLYSLFLLLRILKMFLYCVAYCLVLLYMPLQIAPQGQMKCFELNWIE